MISWLVRSCIMPKGLIIKKEVIKMPTRRKYLSYLRWWFSFDNFFKLLHFIIFKKCAELFSFFHCSKKLAYHFIVVVRKIHCWSRLVFKLNLNKCCKTVLIKIKVILLKPIYSPPSLLSNDDRAKKIARLLFFACLINIVPW